MLRIVCFLFALSCAWGASKCPHYLTVDITDGVKTADGITKHNLTYSPDIYYSRNDRILGCVCELKVCVRKCCGDGQMKTINGCVPYKGTLHIPVFNGIRETRTQLQPFYLIHGSSCTKEVGRLNPKLNVEDNYYTQTNGSILLPSLDNKTLDVSDYCVDNFYDPLMRKTERTVVLCEEARNRNAPNVVGNLLRNFVFFKFYNFIKKLCVPLF